jgi:hypothetical protein
MNPTTRRRLTQILSTVVPGAWIRGPIVLMTPRRRVLRGFWLESAQSPNRVIVWAFVQPLSVPARDIVVSLGDRVGGEGRDWEPDDAEALLREVQRTGTPFLQADGSAAALCRWNRLRQATGWFEREALAGALLVTGQVTEAIEALQLIAEACPEWPAWLAETRLRCATLADVAARDPRQALALLAATEVQSLEALGLSDLP